MLTSPTPRSISSPACRSFERLTLNDTRITDVGLHKLRELKQLESLRIARTAVTPEGVAAFLQTFGAAAGRQAVLGFVLPSQDEWIKAAYYSPKELPSGRHYWRFPTCSDVAPTPATCDACGNVTNAGPGSGAVANYSNAAVWCPSGCAAGTSSGCVPPDGNPGNLTDVGACRSPSPWGTFDQGGNVVEWTDTICAPPDGSPNPANQCIWRQVHGGIAIAADYQLWLSATGATDPYGQALGNVRAFGGFRPAMLPGFDAIGSTGG